MYESYRARIKKLFAKLPQRIYVHYVDGTGERRCLSDADLLLTLITAEKGSPQRQIKYIDPIDLAAIEAKNNILSILLMTSGYKPATHVIARDWSTGESHELTEEELEALDQKLGAMTEAERAAYWRAEEQAFFDYFDRKERG